MTRESIQVLSAPAEAPAVLPEPKLGWGSRVGGILGGLIGAVC